MEHALHERVKIWLDNAIAINEPNWWGFEDPLWIKAFPKFIEYHWKIAPPEIGIRYIMDMRNNTTKQEQSFHDNRQIKYVDSGKHKFTATQTAIGDYILYIMTDEKPYYMIEIHDRVMAHNLREAFKLLWEKI
jgi:hypothetical protein